MLQLTPDKRILQPELCLYFSSHMATYSTTGAVFVFGSNLTTYSTLARSTGSPQIHIALVNGQVDVFDKRVILCCICLACVNDPFFQPQINLTIRYSF